MAAVAGTSTLVSIIVGLSLGTLQGPEHRAVSLRGVVLQADGTPPAMGTQIQLFSPDQNSLPHYVYTDSLGCFRATGIHPNSEYEIAVEVDGGKKTKKVKVGAAVERPHVEIRLTDPPVAGGAANPCEQPAEPSAGSPAGRLTEGQLLHHVRPEYPSEARQRGPYFRLQGKVVLMVIVETDGTVREIRGQSGHPLLIEAAARAVRQWRYAPTRRGKVPVRVVKRVELAFSI